MAQVEAQQDGAKLQKGPRFDDLQAKQRVDETEPILDVDDFSMLKINANAGSGGTTDKKNVLVNELDAKAPELQLDGVQVEVQEGQPETVTLKEPEVPKTKKEIEALKKAEAKLKKDQEAAAKK